MMTMMTRDVDAVHDFVFFLMIFDSWPRAVKEGADAKQKISISNSSTPCTVSPLRSTVKPMQVKEKQWYCWTTATAIGGSFGSSRTAV